jgi:hypothetical protein
VVALRWICAKSAWPDGVDTRPAQPRGRRRVFIDLDVDLATSALRSHRREGRAVPFPYRPPLLGKSNGSCSAHRRLSCTLR